MQKLGKLIQQNGMDNDIELKATFCFENCGQGPNIAVNGEVIGNATPDKITEIFNFEIMTAMRGCKSCGK
jgi:NADH:ubiquinone oxidoreductase subunit E